MNAEFNPNNLVKNLPDAYAKTTDSNNFKILEIERVACNDLRKTLWGYYKCNVCGDTIPFGEQMCPICKKEGVRVNGIDDILDLNNAKGNTLDLYGERVGQARGLANDDKYLLMIKSKILRNLSNGSYPSIANAICSTFNCEPSQVLIIDDTEPCTVKIVTLPLSIINGAGLTTSQTVAIIKSILPVGVSLTSFLFEGTFEFSSAENEYDKEKGFANSESDQSIGGYLGVTSADTTDELLPI